MKIIEKISDMQAFSESLRLAGKKIALVPTMGFFHEGHVSLMKQAKELADVVIVSLYVNPTQFGPNEDFKKYPRDFDRDSKIASEAGVDVLFCPRDEEMYPFSHQSSVVSRQGFEEMENESSELRITNYELRTTNPEYDIPNPKPNSQFPIPNSHVSSIIIADITTKFEGAKRPGHFDGVATVVAKLFNATKPHFAIFGQKDYQQTLVIKRMVSEFLFDIDIIISPTVRESDGLAMSSRNVYLTKEERTVANILFKTLNSATSAIKQGEKRRKVINKLMHENLMTVVRDQVKVLSSKFSVLSEEIKTQNLTLNTQNSTPSVQFRIDYASSADADNLSEPEEFYPGQQVVILLACFLGKTRLIDNVLVTV